MTDRHAAYIVVLEDDIREPVDEYVLNALRMVKGVLSVEPVIASYEQHVARERRDGKWRDALRKLAADGPGDG